MKRNHLIWIAIVLISLFLSSCDKDETIPVPEITLTELGYDNSQIAYAGSDLHIEAEVLAMGRISTITVQIHPEGEDEKSAENILHDDEWEVDTTYTEFSGLKNTTFHKHIEVPAGAEATTYHFHFIVTDEEGQQSSVEEELEIQYPSDSVFPEVTVSEAPTSGQVFNSGETISISGSVSDDQALGGLYIGLVRADQNLSDSDVGDANTITLLHTHDFEGSDSYNFSVGITVGAEQDNNITPKDITGDIAWQSADYYIVVKCKDAFGGNWTFSDHYPIVINY